MDCKQEKRPLGVPTVSDRGRPGLSAHHALATLNEVIAAGKVGWVLEADLKNFFAEGIGRGA